MKETGKPLEGEMELIHRFTRKELEEKDVYVFSVTLCDNEVDRDYEKFSDAALERLAELFVGVTGIADHEPKSRNQMARIFDCRTETVAGKVTSCGDAYRRVAARAYVPRTTAGETLIQELDSGIKKEVSIGCAVRKRTCSVCGKDIGACRHIKGKYYGGKLCYALLEEPADAYEWSFVAVPAQKAAGVMKSFRRDKTEQNETKGVLALDVEKKLLSAEEQRFSAEEVAELAEKFRRLERKAFDGEYYRGCLMKDIRGLSAVVIPELSTELLQKMTEELSVRQLDEMKKALERKASEVLPLKPQLMKSGAAVHDSNRLYQNI